LRAPRTCGITRGGDGYAPLVPKPNPNRIDRQKTPDSPPPRDQGARDAPGDTTDWVAVGHEEAEAQRRSGDAVPAPHGATPERGGRPEAPHTDR
jgi:hypothetical protein